MSQKISNSCNQKVLNDLQKKKHLFIRPNGQSDGVVFLKLIMDKYSSTTIYTSRNIIKQFRKTTLAEFNHDVQKLYEHLEEEVSELEALRFTHDHLLMDVFDILKTSTNEDFLKDFKDEEKKYERGQAMGWNDLMGHAVDTYQDMVDKEIWDVKDPRDAKIMSLATIIHKMVAFSSINNQSNGNKNKRGFNPIDDWKFLRDGDKKEKIVNGTTFYSCPHHYETGMWVTHRPGSCGRATSHTPSKYDKAVQWGYHSLSQILVSFPL